MSQEAEGSGESVGVAYQRLLVGVGLTDPALVEDLLRPWLESRAEQVGADSTMAALSAQQVIVDLGLAAPADFPSARAMQQWLEVRLAQTVALFTGFAIPADHSQPAPSEPRHWLVAWLNLPWLARFGRSPKLPWLLGATASTAVVTGFAAVVMAAAVASEGVNLALLPAGALGPQSVAQVLMPLSTPAPRDHGSSASGSGSGSKTGTSPLPSRRVGGSSSEPMFQPVVIQMSPLGSGSGGAPTPVPGEALGRPPRSAAPPPLCDPSLGANGDQLGADRAREHEEDGSAGCRDQQPEPVPPSDKGVPPRRHHHSPPARATASVPSPPHGSSGNSPKERAGHSPPDSGSRNPKHDGGQPDAARAGVQGHDHQGHGHRSRSHPKGR